MYIIDIEIMINNDLLVTSWQNIERNKWNIMHELVLQIVTQQLDCKKHCAKSTGWWWLFTLTAGDLQKLNLCGNQKKSLIFPQSQPLWSSWVFFVCQLENANTCQSLSSSFQSLPNMWGLSLVDNFLQLWLVQLHAIACLKEETC